MKILCLLVALLIASAVQADTCRQQYERRDRLKTYISDPVAYAQCIEDAARHKLEGELIRSEIELNKAKVKWLKDDNRRRYYHRFPDEVE